MDDEGSRQPVLEFFGVGEKRGLCGASLIAHDGRINPRKFFANNTLAVFAASVARNFTPLMLCCGATQTLRCDERTP